MDWLRVVMAVFFLACFVGMIGMVWYYESGYARQLDEEDHFR